MQILLVGDPHGDRYNISNVLDIANSNGCEKVVLLGDVGYWPHTPDGQLFLKHVEKETHLKNIDIHFIKGNHDNHEWLKQYDHQEIVQLQDHLFYHPNLSTWVWGDYSFCAVGGAHSVDHHNRVEGISWWRDENISMGDVYGCEGISADIILSHDCPLSVNIDNILQNKKDQNTTANRENLQMIVNEIKPRYVFHGHYHKKIIAEGKRDGELFVNVGLSSNKQELETQCLVFDVDSEYHDFGSL